MRKILFAAGFAMFVVTSLFAQTAYLKQSDRLNFADKNQASIKLLLAQLPSVTSPKLQADIYWRLSRDTLRVADDLKTEGGAGASLLEEKYLQGESYADKAIALDPSNPEGYYWKASNIGRWGQTRGILASLFKANPMRDLLEKSARLDPNQGNAWYVLGQLYEQVPGFPLSFGNVVYAVSLGRKAIAARKAELAQGLVPDVPFDYYVQLARHLAKRNWSEAQRVREHPIEAQEYARTNDIVAKNNYYEGAVSIPAESDRQEAIQLSEMVVTQLQAIANRSTRRQRDLNHALHDIRAWSR